jgi:hypothetical protein
MATLFETMKDYVVAEPEEESQVVFSGAEDPVAFGRVVAPTKTAENRVRIAYLRHGTYDMRLDGKDLKVIPKSAVIMCLEDNDEGKVPSGRPSSEGKAEN